MTSETMRGLLEPLIGEFGSITMLVSRVGPLVLSMADHKKLISVEVGSDGLVRLEREHGWAVIDPSEIVSVMWIDEVETHSGQFL